MNRITGIVVALVLVSPAISVTVHAADGESLFERNFQWLADRFAQAGVRLDDDSRSEITTASRFFEARELDLSHPPPRAMTIDGSFDIILDCYSWWGPADCSITPLQSGVELQETIGELWGETRCDLTPQDVDPRLHQPDLLHAEGKNVELYVYGSDSNWPFETPYHQYNWNGKVLGNGCYAVNFPGFFQVYYSNGVAYHEE